MPRIPYPDPATLPEAEREFLASLPQLNISRLLAGCPSMFRPLTRLFNAYLNDGVLSATQREIAILRVGHLCGSEYEVVNHERVARLIGMSDGRIAALREGGDLALFNDEEQAIIAFVDEVVRKGGASEPVFRRLAASLSVAQLIELTVVIGTYTMVSQICATFDIEPEQTPIANSGLEDIRRAVERLG